MDSADSAGAVDTPTQPYTFEDAWRALCRQGTFVGGGGGGGLLNGADGVSSCNSKQSGALVAFGVYSSDFLRDNDLMPGLDAYATTTFDSGSYGLIVTIGGTVSELQPIAKMGWTIQSGS
ncbi:MULTISPECIES: hypothetical protein [Actinomycetes]|uniref:hypothetical protein n=1 Tax=Actinomycetes TaxID=1760 RepID=UPI0012DCF1EB|nr:MULTISPECIES: hypothetical protein [Actinomycetes]